MPRKIFISFLGFANYAECKYSKDTYKSQPVRYIQEASLKYLHANEWDSKDKALILVTEGSYNKNWIDNGHNNYNTKEVIIQSGLETQLEKHKFPFEISNIKIKDGNSEQEIWDIFETIFNLLEDKDEIYIDITHGFRYLPMLSIVLSNYGKLLKDITVKSITYGNYESRDRDSNEAPIIDLTAFSQLQDWTNAANLFVKHGNLDGLADLTKKEISPILAESKGQNKVAAELRKLSDTLKEFSLAIKTNQGPKINSGIIFTKLRSQFKNIKNNFIKPLDPILHKIEDKLEGFSASEDIMNGFKAVDFCIQSGLIQQGYTMLQENMITAIIEKKGLDISKKEYRNIVSGAFKIYNENIPKEKWHTNNKENVSLTEEFLKMELLNELSSTFSAITEKRNIINHAGFNKEASERVFRKMEEDLKEYYKRTVKKLNL